MNLERLTEWWDITSCLEADVNHSPSMFTRLAIKRFWSVFDGSRHDVLNKHMEIKRKHCECTRTEHCSDTKHQCSQFEYNCHAILYFPMRIYGWWRISFAIQRNIPLESVFAGNYYEARRDDSWSCIQVLCLCATSMHETSLLLKPVRQHGIRVAVVNAHAKMHVNNELHGNLIITRMRWRDFSTASPNRRYVFE